jgi:hypothetical protein
LNTRHAAALRRTNGTSSKLPGAWKIYVARPRISLVHLASIAARNSSSCIDQASRASRRELAIMGLRPLPVLVVAITPTKKQPGRPQAAEPADSFKFSKSEPFPAQRAN